jgi:hypothetical protein
VFAPSAEGQVMVEFEVPSFRASSTIGGFVGTLGAIAGHYCALDGIGNMS